MRRAALLALAALAVPAAIAACGQPTLGVTGHAAPPAAPVLCPAPHQVVPGPPGPYDWPVYDRTPDHRAVAVPLPGNRAAGTARPLWSIDLDGATLAQPLIADGLVVQATEHDTVYAFDAVSGCLAWKTSVGTPLNVTTHHLDCNNITPELGITATPAIDTATGTIFVAAYFDPGRYEMDALDLGSGAVEWRRPLDLPNSEVLEQLSRPAVALDRGRAYASFGGRAGDCDTYHGFVIGVPVTNDGPTLTFQVSPNTGGAVWATNGPVQLPNGDLLIARGNTDDRRGFDRGDSVVRLAPDLQPLDVFAPSDWRHLNDADLDLGSVGPTLAGDDRVFQVGKGGVGYLLDPNRLGRVGGQLFQGPLDGGCYAIGATAYAAPLVIVPCDHGLTAVRVHDSQFDTEWRGPDFRSGSPIVAGGLIWDFDFEGGDLWALDPSSGAPQQRIAVGPGEHFVAPSAAGGRLYVPVERRLDAFAI